MTALAITCLLFAAVGDDAKDGWKVHATTKFRVGAKSKAYRTAKELATAMNSDAASEFVAEQLKAPKIDWEKQIVLAVVGNRQRSGGYSIDLLGIKKEDGKLHVRWKLNTPKPGSFNTQALTQPALTLLIDRFDGEIVFEQVIDKGKK